MKYTLQIFTKDPNYDINLTLLSIVSNYNVKFKYFFGVYMIIFESNMNIDDIKNTLNKNIEYDYILLNTSIESNTIKFNLPNLLNTISYDNNPEFLLEKVKKYGNDSLTEQEHKIIQNYLK